MSHYRLYPPPAFVDDLYLRQLETRVEDCTEHMAIVEGEGGHVPEYVYEVLMSDVPALVSEIQRLRKQRFPKTAKLPETKLPANPEEE